jgi:hypothetical protein
MAMAPDDPRHGTYAGAQTHTRERTPKCKPCLRAARAYMQRYRKQERENKCAMTEGEVPGVRSGLGWPLRGSYG